MKLLSSDVEENGEVKRKSQSKKTENPTFSELPLSLLEVIMSNLVLKDNIRASAVCKSWREAALSVRVSDKAPWLMHFPKHSNLCQLYDPLKRKTFELELPELADSKVCYSRDGWLLMRITASNEMFLFNPFIRERINLPILEHSYLKIAFSCTPKSGDTCLVLALKPIGRGVAISTCKLGASEWITENFPCWPPFESHFHSNLVYSNGCFYGLYGEGNLFCINPSQRIWYLLTQPSLTKWLFSNKTELSKKMFLAEHKGVIFGLFMFGDEKPLVYKLESSKWEETNTKHDGLTIFVSMFSTETRIDLPWIRNNVHFSKVPFDGKRFVYYSFDEQRYYRRNERSDLDELCPSRTIWIEAPKKNDDFGLM
ncbi:hypothetical protein AALP_AA6G288300 [Arabis alpina]|uniref:Uncharacterized protein n=1 Tax=Arabis alpina TaxID=50452 RepID=A0A087GSD5_ARAAL|nr:hypothetical protein AALP_AA6G288300 [Arabis alpina]